MTVDERVAPAGRAARPVVAGVAARGVTRSCEIAVGLFASRGYHGVSMDDIGAAAGVTGPALYHHFAGKEAMLVAALTPVSEGLLAGGRAAGGRATGTTRAAALESLVDFHVEFALANPAVIALHLHELDRLPDGAAAADPPAAAALRRGVGDGADRAAPGADRRARPGCWRTPRSV